MRLVLLHGFAQNAACLGPMAVDLARDHTLICPNLPGHGRPSAPVLSLETWAQGLDLGPEVPVVFGYSLGARAALHLGVLQPARVRGLILLGGSPGLEVEAERAARRAQDARWAELLEVAGLDAFLDAWLAQPILADVPADRQERAARLENDPLALAAAMRALGTGAQASLWGALGKLSMPVLLLTGARDAKFGAIAERMVAEIGPRAVHRQIPGAGHSAHLTRPEEVAQEIRAFTGSLGP